MTQAMRPEVRVHPTLPGRYLLRKGTEHRSVTWGQVVAAFERRFNLLPPVTQATFAAAAYPKALQDLWDEALVETHVVIREGR